MSLSDRFSANILRKQRLLVYIFDLTSDIKYGQHNITMVHYVCESFLKSTFDSCENINFSSEFRNVLFSTLLFV